LTGYYIDLAKKRSEGMVMDWYAEMSIERHNERVRDIERYAFLRQVSAATKSRSGKLDRGLSVLGRWMVGTGKRLQAQYRGEADSLDGQCIKPSLLTR